MAKKLYKSRKNKMIDGVCAGLADYIGIDPTLARVIYAALTLFTSGFPGIILYIVLMVIIPPEPAIPHDEPAGGT